MACYKWHYDELTSEPSYSDLIACDQIKNSTQLKKSFSNIQHILLLTGLTVHAIDLHNIRIIKFDLL